MAAGHGCSAGVPQTLKPCPCAAQATAALLPALLPVAAGHGYSAGVPQTLEPCPCAAQATAALLPALLPVAAGHGYSAGVRRRALAIVHSLVRTVGDTLGDDPRAAGALAPLLQPWWPALQAALREPIGAHVRDALLYTLSSSCTAGGGGLAWCCYRASLVPCTLAPNN